jgi:hypothetical protein
MGNVVLLGDSIFDNARYVPGDPPVIEQLRRALPLGWRATLLAVDGGITTDVARQLKEVPADTTHLIASAGGNDALGESSILNAAARTVSDALYVIQEARIRFGKSYRAMLKALMSLGKPAAVCTVYDSVPGLGPDDLAALACFNEVILREAFAAGLPVIDLRLVCHRQSDYSHVSPIEPSAEGGAKIARVVAELVTTHDFTLHRSTIHV